jgi:hypothetical protein
LEIKNIKLNCGDSNIYEYFNGWVTQIQQNQDENKQVKSIDIKYYQVKYWWQKIIPSFIWKLFHKPDIIFEKCKLKAINNNFDINTPTDPNQSISVQFNIEYDKKEEK